MVALERVSEKEREEVGAASGRCCCGDGRRRRCDGMVSARASRWSTSWRTAAAVTRTAAAATSTVDGDRAPGPAGGESAKGKQRHGSDRLADGHETPAQPEGRATAHWSSRRTPSPHGKACRPARANAPPEINESRRRASRRGASRLAERRGMNGARL